MSEFPYWARSPEQDISRLDITITLGNAAILLDAKKRFERDGAPKANYTEIMRHVMAFYQTGAAINTRGGRLIADSPDGEYEVLFGNPSQISEKDLAYGMRLAVNINQHVSNLIDAAEVFGTNRSDLVNHAIDYYGRLMDTWAENHHPTAIRWPADSGKEEQSFAQFYAELLPQLFD